MKIENFDKVKEIMDEIGELEDHQTTMLEFFIGMDIADEEEGIPRWDYTANIEEFGIKVIKGSDRVDLRPEILKSMKYGPQSWYKDFCDQYLMACNKRIEILKKALESL